ATRAISAIASSGRSKWSMAPLHSTPSKLSEANGSASDQPRTQCGVGPPARFPATSFAQPVMRADGSQAITSAPVSASATASWPKPAATSSSRRPAPPPASARVSAVMRSNRYSLSRVDPVGMTSLMSRSRSTTRTAAHDRARALEPPADEVLEQLREPRIDALEADADALRARVAPGDPALQGQRNRDAGQRELAGDVPAHLGQIAAQLEPDAARREVAARPQPAPSGGGELHP